LTIKGNTVINKRDLLSQPPIALGLKDAVHVAIASVRAAHRLSPGQKCSMNEHNEAIADRKGVGIVSPFIEGDIERGDSFWLLLYGKEIPKVEHHWEHPKFSFEAPKREIQLNEYLLRDAEKLGVTYQQLMDALEATIENWESKTPYPGTLTEEEIKEYWDYNRWEVWDAWGDEVGYEFENIGTACCPETEIPEGAIFTFEENKIELS
jgi:hypothetical protein